MIAVTGASGYVGGVIADALEPQAVRLVRRPRSAADLAWSFDMPAAALAPLLRERQVTQLVHAAWDMRASRLTELERGCVAGSLRLLEAAAMAGISRLVFISSISAFPGARSAYGQAKLQVETAVLSQGGVVLRLGLVHGAGDGGIFGAMRASVRKSRFIPLIGDGSTPQYLLDEAALGSAVRAALQPSFVAPAGPITLADPRPVPFRDIVRDLARQAGRRVTLVPIPWQCLYAGFWSAERLGLRLGFRSDSVLSFVNQNPNPDFSAQQAVKAA